MSRNTIATAGMVGACALVITLFTGAAISAMALQAMKQSDKTLQDRIEYRLDTNAALKKYDIKVKVDAGVAWLSGDVATSTQKDTAAKVASVDGITKVQNDIKVDPQADVTLADRAKKGLNKAGEAITDSWITTKVHWFFMGEDLLKGSDINVDTANHVVTLKGTVKSEAARARALELARQTEGVTKVNDSLTIK